MFRKPLFLLCLLFVAAVDRSAAQAIVLKATDQPNTWSATSSTGLTLMGTWTVIPDPKTGTVIGTWTLIDAKGTMITGGGWSAAKSPAGWTGTWRANISGSTGEHSGGWSARADLKENARFADLFEKALQSIVSGSWRYGRYSGEWSIRAFK